MTTQDLLMGAQSEGETLSLQCVGIGVTYSSNQRDQEALLWSNATPSF